MNSASRCPIVWSPHQNAQQSTRGEHAGCFTKSSFPSAGYHRLREYCESETFRPRCGDGEVIVMQSATYGRMRLGRCVTSDLGYLGCSSNVLAVTDTRCSGRRECQVRIPDPELDSTKPCFKELKIYLSASFTCVPGK